MGVKTQGRNMREMESRGGERLECAGGPFEKKGNKREGFTVESRLVTTQNMITSYLKWIPSFH